MKRTCLAIEGAPPRGGGAGGPGRGPDTGRGSAAPRSAHARPQPAPPAFPGQLRERPLAGEAALSSTPGPSCGLPPTDVSVRSQPPGDGSSWLAVPPQPCQHLEVFVRFNEPQPPALNIQMISKAYFKAKCCVVVRGDFRVIRSAQITVKHSSLVVRQRRDSALREASDAQSAGRPRPRHWLSASDGGTTASMPGHDPWLPCGHASRLRFSRGTP